MNFERHLKQFETFKEEIDAIQLQLEQTYKSFFQNEEKVKSDMEQLRENFNLQVDGLVEQRRNFLFQVNELQQRIRDSEDRMRIEHELIRKHFEVKSRDDEPASRLDDKMSTQRKKTFVDHSYTLKPQESLKQDDLNDVIRQESDNEVTESKIPISNIVDDDKKSLETFENDERLSQPNPDPSARISRGTFHSTRRGVVNGIITRNSNENSDRDLQEDEPYKSRSFHMYAVGIVTDSKKSSKTGWAVTLISLAFTFAQFFVLTTVVYEASHPTCVSHDDCRFGEYCDMGNDEWKGDPRCEDCNQHLIVEKNCDPFLKDLDQIEYDHPDYVEIDYTKIAFGINLDEFNETQKDCLVQVHCNETDVDDNVCDFLKMSKLKWHYTQQFVFVFMSVLFAALLCSDIQDAIAEETYMNIGLKNSSLEYSSKIAGEFLRVTLRSRQLILPCYATSAAISIIISEPLTAQNMLLNLLTIEVILVADDMFAVLVLPVFHQGSTDKLVRQAVEEGVKVSYVWSRIISAIATLLLVITVFEFSTVMNWFDDPTKEYQTCGDIAQSLEYFFNLTISGCACVIHGFVVFINRKWKKMTKRIMLSIGQALIDGAAWAIAYLAWTSVLMFTTIREVEGIMKFASLFTLLYVATYFIFHAIRLRFKSKLLENAHGALYDSTR